MSKESRTALIARANALLSKKPYTQEDNALFNSLMKLSDVMAESPAIATDEKRAASEYFRKLVTGPAIRTYQPMSTSLDSQISVQSFETDLKTMMLADGPIYAGSPLLSNVYAKQMNPSKLGVSDDLSSTGYVLTENVGPASDEAEINFSGVTFGQTTFSSGIILVSTSLNDDLEAWITTESLVKRTASARLSRIMNATWLASLKTSLAANSSATVAAGGSNIAEQDIPTLVSAVGAAYRPNAAFAMSPATQKAISLLLDGNGMPVYRHILEPQPTLLNYPVHIVKAAATKDILFGDFSYGVAKSMPIELRTLKERFILDGYTGLILLQRADFQWTVASTSDSPVKYLTFS